MIGLLQPLTIPLLLAMFLAVNMGGSGVAPSFSAAYGAGIVKRNWIPALFGVMVLLGALIAGKQVIKTLGDGLLEQSFFDITTTSIILLSISLSLLIANLLGVPQSTSHSTVLSIAGAAFALGKLKTETLFYEIIPMWALLPIISFSSMFILSKWIFPFFKKSLVTTDYRHLNEHRGLKVALVVASLYVAFSIGSNNVANAAGPIASLTMNELGSTCTTASLPILILCVLVISPCFAIGGSILGYKGIRNTGKDIVEVTPFYATVIALIVATLLLYASVTKGIPTSLVQLNGGAFIALSIVKKGWRNTFSNKTVQMFFSVWAVAPIFAFTLTFILMKLFVV